MSENGLLHEFCVSIGGIKIEISAAEEGLKFKKNEYYERFLVKGKPEVRLNCYHKKFQMPPTKQVVFNSKSCWKLFSSNSELIFGFYSPDYGTHPYKVAVMQPDFLSGVVYSRDICEDDAQLYNPLDYPLDEVLMVNLLGKERGIMMHASGMSINGKGMIFCGKSGAGKSTITNILLKGNCNSIFNDDRIIIRKNKSGFTLYGTPWHGDVWEHSSEETPLKRIFFIKHGNVNRLMELSLSEKVSRLVSLSFSAFWDKQAMGFTLDLCYELARNILIYELEFLPDESSLSFIEKQI
ncbi:MAG: hypothetical protein V1739_05440 [Candidatus Omnitrophota bacterium]